MKTETLSFTGFGGTQLPAQLWLPEGNVRCLLQITHGMTEHIGCYQHLAEKLTGQGIIVAGFDLRGHGRNPGGSLAVFGDGDWEASLQDMKYFFEILHHRFPEVPHYLYGFSLGSFLVRDYLDRTPEGVDGALILGTGNQPKWLLNIMLAIVRSQVNKVGSENSSPFIRTLSFGSYNQKFKPTRTDADWLCSDEDQLDQYRSDPLCRDDISSGLFYQMLEAMVRTGSRNACQNWNKSMPVLLLCGQDDPVGDMGKGTLAVKRQLEKAGISRIFFHLLPQARHMVLCEEKSGAAEETVRIIGQFLLQECDH